MTVCSGKYYDDEIKQEVDCHKRHTCHQVVRYRKTKAAQENKAYAYIDAEPRYIRADECITQEFINYEESE